MLFADGLRFDIAQRLTATAEEGRLHVSRGHRWAALPTVTATAKPAVSPIADKLAGRQLGQDFLPEIAETEEPLTTDRFRKLVADGGYEVLGPSDLGHPERTGGRAWTEYGEFDKLGHKLGAKLAARIDDQLELLLERIQALLAAGWKCVRVVTDHGWLLVPGGLPATDLPKYLTECRWSRCAAIKATAHVEVPAATWHWNPHEQFAFGPGVHCFGRGNEYAHGGVSLQECLLPNLRFVPDEATIPTSVSISNIQWHGMRCRVAVSAGGMGITADMRTKPNDPASSICEPKMVDSEGRAGLLVEDDSNEGTTVSLVLLDASGRVVAKQATTVGGEE